MDPVVALLLKNGVFGILAGVGFYLYFHERKINRDNAKEYLQHQVADTAAKTKLTVALEDLAVTVDVLGQNARADISGCKANVDDMIKIVRRHLHADELERAKEEGRKEVTGRFKLPIGENDDQG
jgi:hypothetical protein